MFLSGLALTGHAGTTVILALARLSQELPAGFCSATVCVVRAAWMTALRLVAGASAIQAGRG
jgi:hypothetical protein